MGFSRQEYRSGLPFPSPGDLPDPGIEPGSPALQTDSLLTELQGKPHHKSSQPTFSTAWSAFLYIVIYTFVFIIHNPQPKIQQTKQKSGLWKLLKSGNTACLHSILLTFPQDSHSLEFYVYHPSHALLFHRFNTYVSILLKVYLILALFNLSKE